MCRYLSVLVGATLLFVSSIAYSQDYSIEEVLLHKQVVNLDSELILKEPIVQLAKSGDDLIAFGNRSAWKSNNGVDWIELDIFDGAPRDTDWINKTCSVNGLIIASLASYPEARRQKENASPLGAYKKGAEGRGIIILEEGRATYLRHLDILSYSDEILDEAKQYPPDYFQLPKFLDTSFQSCSYYEHKLVVAGYGYLAELSLKSFKVRLIEYDLELSLNRKAVFVDGANLWVSRDEGGIAGGCITVHSGKADDSMCLLNFNNNEIHTNSIFKYNGQIFTTSLAGLVQVDRDRKKFTHYQVSKDPKKMRLFSGVVDNSLIWAVSDDGFNVIDLKNSSYKLYRLKNTSNEIYGVIEFKGKVYVSNDHSLYRVNSNISGLN